MRKAGLLVLIIMAATLMKAGAQGHSYHFGLQVSPNISWIKPEVEGVTYEKDGSLIGVSYGAVFENYFTPNIGIMLGLNVLYTGGKLKYPYINPPVSTAANPIADTGTLFRKYNLQYIEIPLMLKGSTGDILGKFSFYGRFGISNGFNIKARAEDEFLSNRSLTGENVDNGSHNVKKQVSFFREAMLIGVGAEYRIGNKAMAHLGLTFSNGFTDILSGYSTYSLSTKEKARSNCVELNIGIVF